MINSVPKAQLRRFSDGVGGFFFDNEWLAYSLENPAKQILPGEYIVIRDDTGKHKWFKLLDVPGRSDIEIHPANEIDELDGCIALGAVITHDQIVAGTSRKACHWLSERLGDRTAFLLVIA